ncbi:MAG: hypothetical protein D6686_03615 [Alphaproteobacteria bacterium]|nr:MAG: hypothetical protein D6686_03615 [Alphaproteobacteria bacterium]
MTLTGGCQCGAVRINCHAPPLAMIRCHCTDCQRQSASAFGLSVYLPPDALSVDGPVAWFETRTAAGRQMRRHFCPRCGVRLWHRRHPDAAFLALKGGVLDPGHGLEPVAELWTRARLGWVALIPGALVYETQPADWAPVFARFAARRAEAAPPEAGDALDRFAAALPPGAQVLDLGRGGHDATRRLRAQGFAVTTADPAAAIVAGHPAPPAGEGGTGPAFDAIWADLGALHIPRAAWPGLPARIARGLRAGGVLHLGLTLPADRAGGRDPVPPGPAPAEALRRMVAAAGLVILRLDVSPDAGGSTGAVRIDILARHAG